MDKIRLLFVLLTISCSAFAAPPMGTASDPTSVTSSKAEPVQVAQSDSAAMIAIGTSIVALVGVMFNGFMAYLMAKLNKRAAEVKEINAAAAEKQEETLETVKTVHSMVNGNMRAALQNAADYSQRIADLTKSPVDKMLAKKALDRLRAHNRGQALVDRRNRTR